LDGTLDSDEESLHDGDVFEIPTSWGIEIEGNLITFALVVSPADTNGFEIQTIGPVTE
jgi:hypothetical protein